MKKNDEKIEKEENMTSSTLEKRRKMTSAGYTMAMTALVLVFIIVINLLVGSLSTDVRTIDLTNGDIFTLTDVTKNYLNKLEKDVNIYLILEDITNRNDDLNRLLEVYDDASEHITVSTVNPAQNPTFMENREYVSEGSIIVECGDRFRGVELSTMYVSSNDSSTGNTSYYYDMEGQITSAIDYVVSEDIPKAYLLKSTTRDSFSSSLLTDIAKQNIDIESIEVSKDNPIPEDADIVILDLPIADISNEEYEQITSFMDNGGSLLMFEHYNIPEDTYLTNIEKLLEKYNISVEYGAAIESNTSYMYNSQAYFGKPVLVKHEITQDLIDSETNLIVAMGDAINIGEEREGLTVEPLLTSTPKAYYKDASFKKGSASTSMTQLSTDPVGTFNYAVAVTDKISEEVTSKLVYISSYAFAKAEQFENLVGTGNAQFVVKCLQWLANQEKTISIPMKSRTYSNLVYTIDAQHRILYVIVIIIPAAVLVYGVYVWFRRRKR